MERRQSRKLSIADAKVGGEECYGRQGWRVYRKDTPQGIRSQICIYNSFHKSASGSRYINNGSTDDDLQKEM